MPGHSAIPKLLRSRFVWLGLIVSLFVAAAGLLLRGGSDRVTKANFSRIKEGMTQEEVESILGGPCRDHTHWPHARHHFPSAYLFQDLEGNRSVIQSWFGEEGVAVVHFDSGDGRARKTMFLERRMYKDRTERIVDWLRELPGRFKP